jgi:glycine/D-amino acid oxidase-like deaminating enzyme/nitrite reductase/ring-hydroxylating ferredoxin subunit
MPNYTNSVWSESTPAPPYPVLDGNVGVDVAIVGGGITGITAALLLQRAGKRCAVIEARRIGKGETGKSTAHLTTLLDAPYHTLVSRFGMDGARLAAAAQRAAIDRIASLGDELNVACDFRRIPGYLYAERQRDVAELEREAETCAKLGLDATLVGAVPLPFPVARGLRIDNQAAMHPRIYLQALAAAFTADGGSLFEETQVVAIDEGDLCRVISDRGVVTARAVIVAAHVPIANRVLLHAKLAAYRSYVVSVDAGSEPDAMFWDMAQPYHYIRKQRVGGRELLMIGGEDHKVGELEDTTLPFARLESYVQARFGRAPAATDFRWSGQIVMSADGLPYVGRNSLSSRVYVATGYGGNGITQGTLAAMVLSDEVCGLANPFAELLNATRIKPLASAKAVVSENVDFPRHLVGDRLSLRRGDHSHGLASIAPGEGKVVTLEGEHLAVYRNANGQLSALSPVCTHLGCIVHWNSTEVSWDCPCHGSRFDPQGRVLNGPAVAALEARPLPEPIVDDGRAASLERAEERPDPGAGE